MVAAVINIKTFVRTKLILPPTISQFEQEYLARANKLGLAFLYLHLPVFVLIAWANDTNPTYAGVLTTLVLLGPLTAFAGLANPRHVSVVYAIAAMALGALLVHFGQGPMQIEMHFYFLVLIAMLGIYGNPAVILAAVVAVVLHHAVGWFIARESVFASSAPLKVVAVHAVFVAVEATGAIFIARTFFDNVIGLERIVAVRTEEVAAKERDLQMILDHVEYGFCMIRRDASLLSGRSAALEKWFGDVDGKTKTIFDLFARRDAEFAAKSQVGWAQVEDGFLPPQLTLGQMPRELVNGPRVFDIVYKPIRGNDDEIYLVIITDVSAMRAHEIAEQERAELFHVIERLLADRTAFFDFCDEASLLVAAIKDRKANADDRKRAIHTLKGNAMIFGIESVARVCESLETQLTDGGEMSSSLRKKLDRRWTDLIGMIEPIAGADRSMIQLSRTEHAALEEAAAAGELSFDQVVERVHAWKLQPIQQRLDLCAEHLRRLAGQREVGIEVRAHGHDLRIESQAWSSFWNAFIHVLRNVVSHGIESLDERMAAGKPADAQVRLESWLEGDELWFEVRDDGPGIDWTKIAERAAERGLAHATPSDLEHALFADGVSTAGEVDGLAGRGVGTSAVLAATKGLGGRVVIESDRGKGTTFRFIFPRSAMDPTAAESANSIRTLLVA
jgi:two-component system chemotaxis sensor kinase CheA